MASITPAITEAVLAEARYVRPREAARYAGLSETEIRRAIHSGKLVARRYGRRWLIDKAEIDRWIRENTEPNVA